MRSVRNIFASERGASFIVALIVFLICAAAASAVLMAASANADHTTREQAAEQAFLNLESAAQLLTNDIAKAGDKLAVTEKGGSMKLCYDGDAVDNNDASKHTVLIRTMAALTAQANSLASGNTPPQSLTVAVDGLRDVTGTVAMTRAYGVIINLTTTDAESNAYALTVTVPTKKTTSDGADTYTYGTPTASKGTVG